MDSNPCSGADVIHDLNVRPYPFDDASADEVNLDNVLEHLGDVIGVMEEVHRLLRPGGLVTIHVPYFRSRWAAVDPTHRHQFTVESFGYFDPDHAFFDLYRYTEARFRVESVRFNERWASKGLRAAVSRFANRRPSLYEARLSTLYPLDELTFRLRSLP